MRHCLVSDFKCLTCLPEFLVNGKGIPDVDFDVGESYAGLMPISPNADDQQRLYFWYFPSPNTAASKEILIWLNVCACYRRAVKPRQI